VRRRAGFGHGSLGGFDGGHLVLVSAGAEAAADSASLRARVSGAPYLYSVLGSVFTAETLPEALRVRRTLGAGQSVVTRDGVWLGADWLRLSRDPEPHTGVIEREETLRALRAEVSRLETEVKNGEHELERRHERVRECEDRRERLQTEVNRLHREHVDRRAEHDSAQARRADAERRLSQLETGLADVTAELDRTSTDLRSARARMETAIDVLAALEPQRIELENERERLRAEQTAARANAQSTQQLARELALQVESRRTSHAALESTLARLDKQHEDLLQRRDELLRQLAADEAPLAALRGRARARPPRARRSRASCMPRASRARISMRCCASARARKLALDERVEAARAALDDARLAAQQVRVRRESIAEQLAATSFELLRAPRRPRAGGDRGDLGGGSSGDEGQDRAPGTGEPRRHR
jgi:chromosome segregation protein